VNNIDAHNTHFRKAELLKKNRNYFYHPTYPLVFRLKNLFINLISRQYEIMVINHQPQPHLKSALLEIQQKCQEQYEATSASKFRDRNNITQYLFRFWNLAKGNFIPLYHRDHLHLDIKTREALEENIKHMKNKRFVCANDNLLNENDFEPCKALFNQKLNDLLPGKSLFEL